MKIFKAGAAGATGIDTAAELEAINRFAKAELTVEQVYTFSVVLCDNEVDRDFEKFSNSALEELAALFVGRTGIFDHEWKAINQTARIYRTELVKSENVKTGLGEDYCVLKGYAYMLRNEKNAALIEEIDAGIKKETSIGCSVKRRVCSICGEECVAGGCGHIPGREYDGKLCYLELFDVSDAYEWSFVAVPAQRAAGVVKKLGGSGRLKAFVQSAEGAAYAPEYEALEKHAALGREYCDRLQREVVRLGLLCDKKLYSTLEAGVKHMGTGELNELKEVFEKRLEGRFPPRTQLPGRNEIAKFDGGDYMI
ncbi:MAG: hypothetical protein EOM14_06000 [Clostridia bacterium]|nr:hypothetical protein [Clostridia bacterium]